MSEVNTDPSVIKMDDATRAVDACRGRTICLKTWSHWTRQPGQWTPDGAMPLRTWTHSSMLELCHVMACPPCVSESTSVPVQVEDKGH